jgi:NhaC family Na+:H+ antiporter
MEPKQLHPRRDISIGLSALPFLITGVALFFSLFMWDLPIYGALLAGWGSGFLIAVIHGFSWRHLLRASYDGMKSTFIVVTILLLIGGVIAIWMASGAIAGLIVYGIEIVTPQLLVVSAFLLTFVMSMLLGTSVGTLSTMGIALTGMAHVFGIPGGLIGGALISGAMVGDRTSPLSGTVYLLSSTIGTKVEKTIPRLIRSGLPVFVISLILYLGLGFRAIDERAAAAGSVAAVEGLRLAFQLPWWVLLPPVLVLILAFLRVPIRTNLLLGILMGSFLTYFLQERGWEEIGQILLRGYYIESSDGRILLQGGGILKMLGVIWIILFAGALNGIMETSGMMLRLIGGLLDRIKREGSLLMATVLISITAGLIFCNQALMVIIPGRMLQPKYQELGLDRMELGRTLSDSGVVFSALIPWNLHAILSSTAMGIDTATYWPYAFFLWMLPLFAIMRGIWRNLAAKRTHVVTHS